MAKYDISKQALEDLYKIWEYTVDTWSETQADKYYELLEDAMDEIGTNPQKTGKPYDEIMTGLKGYHAGKVQKGPDPNCIIFGGQRCWQGWCR